MTPPPCAFFPGRCGNRVAGFIFAIRSAALKRLDRLYANDAYANGMMQAILIGATAKLDRMWTEDYRSTGTFHALVISGSHVAVLAAVFLFFLRICAVPRGIALLLTILAAWLYAGVTGWQAPVLRSAAGMSLYGIGRFFYREGRLLNILAAVALIFVVADPEQLFDASFQLSFLAVALIGAFVVPALGGDFDPLARGLTDLDDTGERHSTASANPPSSALEMRLLARTLSLTLRLPAKAGAIRRRHDGALLPLRLGNLRDLVLHPDRPGAADDRLLPSAVGLGTHRQRHRRARAERDRSAGLHGHRGKLHPARSALRLAVVRRQGRRRFPCPLGAGLAHPRAAVLARRALRRGSDLGGVANEIPLAHRRRMGWPLPLALAVIVAHPFPPVVEHGKFELSAIDVGQGDSLLVGVSRKAR